MTPEWELVYSLRLPQPTVLLNVWMAMHYHAKSRHLKALQWMVLAAAGKRPNSPLQECRIHVTRGNPKPFPDPDGVFGGLKPLLDVLGPFHPKVHPYGLEFIVNDAQSCIKQLTAESVVAPRGEGFTLVEIYRPAALARAA